MFRILLIVVIIIGCFSAAFSQKEPKVTQLGEVGVTVNRINRYYVDSINVYISKQEIEALQPNDLGEILKKLPGVNMKSYGGLGGMKTVSLRGLGGQHTNFVVDGFRQSQTQTGQVNMGAVQVDFVESIVVQRGGSSELQLPAAAQIGGNAIVMETYHSHKPRLPLQHRLVSKFGSFGQMEQHYVAKLGSEKVFGGAFLKYRNAHGEYPFKYMNYQTEQTAKRKNNDYTDLFGGFDVHARFKKGQQFNMFFEHQQMNQGVPGAVVLYNDFAKQRLSTVNTQLKADFRAKVKGISYRLFYTIQQDSLFYRDPSYLNEQGELRSSFRNNSHDFGLNISTSFSKFLHLNVGVQEVISKLRSVESLTATPERFHMYSYAKLTFNSTRWKAIAQAGYQFVQETNKDGNKAPNRSRVNPYVEVRHHFNEKFSLIGYYRNSMRMPNFNELYYNNIGNTDLKPEDANQFSLSSSLTLINNNQTYLGFQAGGYFQIIKNMILTIPTQNLFVWSIQNIGKNQVTGFEVLGSYSYNINKNIGFQLTANYTFQESLDISNSESPSYKHIVAYSPKHTLNADFTIQIKESGIRFSSFYSSGRYTLNENIPANFMEGITSFDLSVFSRFKLDANNAIRLQLTMKNFTNNYYAYVKNYIMPGRQIIFTFIYAFG